MYYLRLADKFFITVNPTTSSGGGSIIPTLTPTQSPLAVKITEHKDGDIVNDNPVTVTDTIKNFINDGLTLWIFVESYDDIWYPQETLTMIGEENWEADTNPGFSTNTNDTDKEFGIVVLVATKEAEEELRKPLRCEGDITDGWGLKSLPDEGIIILVKTSLKLYNVYYY